MQVILLQGTMIAALAKILLLMTPVMGIDMKMDLEAYAGANPVSKVVALLKDMQKTIEKEGEEDEAEYEKMACWCATNDKEKTKAINEASTRIEDLTSAIEEGTGGSSRLNTEIANLEKEIAKNQAALDKAQAMRTKELAEFNAEEKDALGSISALKSAIIVLSKHHSASAASFLQVSSTELSQVATTAHEMLKKNEKMFEGVLSDAQKQKVVAFAEASAKVRMQNRADAAINAAFGVGRQKYAPASGEIFGIMKAMKESFEANLANSKKDEASNQKDFEDLKASKGEEIAAGKEQLEAKTQELASTDEKLATNKQDLDETTVSMGEDEKFLANLKEECKMLDEEWERRQKDRNIELEAVGKALAYLNSDEAHELFSKTFSFVQTRKVTNSKQRAAASKLLSNIAQKSRNPKLMTLATRIRLDAFTEVKKAIDDMIAQLTKEKKDEIKHKDYCIENLNENEKVTARKGREQKDVLEKIEDLSMTIDGLSKDVSALKAEVAEMQKEMKYAGEDREVANKEFQKVVAEQRASAKLLGKALEVLEGAFKKAAAFNQEQPVALTYNQAVAFDQEQDAASTQEQVNAALKVKSGVLKMIEGLIGEAKDLEAEAVRAEEDAQKAYEEFVRDTNSGLEEKTKEITTKSELLAKAESEKTKSEESRDDIMLELEMLSNEAADLHKACDFVLKNFDKRQSARDDEIEGLKQAKSILSGAKFIQYLQFSPDFKRHQHDY